MFSDFINEQEVVSKTLINAIKMDKLSHAYLFDISNYDKGFEFIIEFIKCIVCTNKQSENNHNDCSICDAIQNGNYLDIEIINPDGLWIKKEQMDNLQHNFSCKSLLNNYKIYIINGAEYLNTMASNSLLKFLEEPEDKIIAILLTKNINNILDTIKSRCQIFTLNYIERIQSVTDKVLSYSFNSAQDKELFLENNNIDNMINLVIDFVINFEKKGKDMILYTQKYWFNIFKDKMQNIFGLNLLILLYKDVVNYKFNKKIDIFMNYQDSLKFIEENNSLDTLYSKINIISKIKERNKINVNLNLNIDNLILEMEKIEHEGCRNKI